MKKKKAKPIQAEQYIEENDLEIEEEQAQPLYEDDYFEEETSIEREDEEQQEKYEEATETFNRFNSIKFMKIINIIFTLIILVMIVISIDVICVARYNVGPFFAIKTNVYKDGGTKEYYGLGYKVIKYNEINGRQDTQIGFWSMKYNTKPVFIEDIDLAIEFQSKPEKTSSKYYKQYVSIYSTIKEINEEKNKIVLEYTDPDGKYTLQTNCEFNSENKLISNYKVGSKKTIKGTIYEFSIKENDKPNSVYVSNCFVE